MPENGQVIERALSGRFSTSGSFEDERLRLLWERCRLLFATGLAITMIMLVLSLIVPAEQTEFESRLSQLRGPNDFLAHAVSFAIALGLFYLVSSRSYRFLHTIVFTTIAFNVMLEVFHRLAFHPEADPYTGLTLLLFLSAAFVPWRPSHQWALAALSAVWFLILQGIVYLTVPEYQAYWAEIGGAEAARNHTVRGVVLIAILGGTSAFVSHTLYNLTKTAHQAKRLGKYLIRGELGKGGMGTVFFAQHSLMCRPTAVKVMAPWTDGERTALARFEREVRLSATLTHPNTITIYDVGRTPDHLLYYAMEFLEGLDIQQLVEQHGPMSPARAVHVLTQVCDSLAEAHERGIIHRDVKPSNIFLTRRGGIYDFVKVLDFGLAKQVGSDTASAITKTGMLFGTPRFIAPETVYGDEQVDGRADLYCLGGVAYWMLTGQPPFVSDSSVEVVIDHVKTIPKRPSEVTELPIPAELEAIVMKCLEKKPADRYATVDDLRRALEDVPLHEAWNRDRARKWWDLYGIVNVEARDQMCFFPEPELVADAEASMSAHRTE